MPQQPLSVIKNWFRTGLKPTQSQFWDTWDSFWHKDGLIPTAAIDGLEEYVDDRIAFVGPSIVVPGPYSGHAAAAVAGVPVGGLYRLAEVNDFDMPSKGGIVVVIRTV